MSPQLEVRLEWYGAHDLDLFVIEPDGNEISCSHTDGAMGGGVYAADESGLPLSMMCDATTLYIERVVWDQVAMPASGNYQIQIANGRADTTTSATIVVMADGVERLRRELTTPARKGQRAAPVSLMY